MVRYTRQTVEGRGGGGGDVAATAAAAVNVKLFKLPALGHFQDSLFHPTSSGSGNRL